MHFFHDLNEANGFKTPYIVCFLRFVVLSLLDFRFITTKAVSAYILRSARIGTEHGK